MTPLEKRLVEAGTAMAGSIGHKPGCPKVASAIPCICGHGQAQSKALADWLELMREIAGEE